MMAMLVMLVLLLILPPLQTNTAQVQRRVGLGDGHTGPVGQESETDGTAYYSQVQPGTARYSLVQPGTA